LSWCHIELKKTCMQTSLKCLAKLSEAIFLWK